MSAKISAAEVINRLRPHLNRIAGAQVFLQASQDLRIGGRGGNAMYQYTIQADNIADLQTWGPRLLDGIKKLPGFQDVSSDQQDGGLDELLHYNRVAAAQLEFDVQHARGYRAIRIRLQRQHELGCGHQFCAG